MRDFNRIEIAGVDPEIVEKAQADFEGKVATALKKLDASSNFSGETKNIILELIGMLAIKSPEMRRHLAEPQIKVAKLMMAMNLASGRSIFFRQAAAPTWMRHCTSPIM